MIVSSIILVKTQAEVQVDSKLKSWVFTLSFWNISELVPDAARYCYYLLKLFYIVYKITSSPKASSPELFPTGIENKASSFVMQKKKKKRKSFYGSNF